MNHNELSLGKNGTGTTSLPSSSSSSSSLSSSPMSVTISNPYNGTLEDAPIRRTSILETVYEELQEKSSTRMHDSFLTKNSTEGDTSSSSSSYPSSSNRTRNTVYDNYIPSNRTPNDTNPPKSSTFDDTDGNLRVRIGDVFLSHRYPSIEYRVEGIQGTGSFGTVVKARIVHRSSSTSTSSTVHAEPLPSFLCPDTLVAIKIIRNHPVYRSQASLEIHLLTLLSKTLLDKDTSTIPSSSMNNNHIVRLYDHFTAAGGHLCIVLEYLPTTIFDLIQKSGFVGLTLPLIKIILIQLLFVIHKLHVQGLIHSDIKPENIMLNGKNIATLLTVPESFEQQEKSTTGNTKINPNSSSSSPPSLPVSTSSPPPVQLLASAPAQLYHKYLTTLPTENYTSPSSVVVKLIDFGSAGYEHTNCYHYVQSRFYRAPEVMFGCTYDGSADIWSIGCVVAELFFGLPLFPGCDELDCVRRIFTLLGWAPEYMIIGGNQAHRFFTEDCPSSPSSTIPTVTNKSVYLSDETNSQSTNATSNGSTITDPVIQDVVRAVSATIESSVKDKEKTEEEYGRPRHGAFAEPSMDDLDLTGTDDSIDTNDGNSTRSTSLALLHSIPSLSITVSCRAKLAVPSRTLHFVHPQHFAKLTGKPMSVPKYYYASNCLEQLVLEYDDRQGFIPNLYNQRQTILLQQIQEYRQQLEGDSKVSPSVNGLNGDRIKFSGTSSSIPDSSSKTHNSYYTKQVNLPYPLDNNAIQERKLFADLLHSLLSIDPKIRPTAAQALHHPFFHTDKEISKLYLDKPTLTVLGQEDEQYVKPRRQKTIEINTQAYNHACVRNGIGIHHLRQPSSSHLATSSSTTVEHTEQNNQPARYPSSSATTVYRPERMRSMTNDNTYPSPESSYHTITNDITYNYNYGNNNGSSNSNSNGFWWLSPEQQQHIYQSMPWLFPSFNTNTTNGNNDTSMNYYDSRTNSSNTHSSFHPYYDPSSSNTTVGNNHGNGPPLPGYNSSPPVPPQRGHSYSMSAIHNNTYSPVLQGRGRYNSPHQTYNPQAPDFLGPPTNGTNYTVPMQNNGHASNDYRSRGVSNISDYNLPLSPSSFPSSNNNGNNNNSAVPDATAGYYNGEGLRMSTVIKEGYISLGRSISGESIVTPPVHAMNYPYPAPAPPPPSVIPSVRNSPYPSYAPPSQPNYYPSQQRSRAPSAYSIGYANDSPSLYPPLPTNGSPYSVHGYSPSPLLSSSLNDQSYGSVQSPGLLLPPSVVSIARGSPSTSFSLDSPVPLMAALSLTSSGDNSTMYMNNASNSSNNIGMNRSSTNNGYTYASSNYTNNGNNGMYRNANGNGTYRHRSGSGRSTDGPGSPLTNTISNNGFYPNTNNGNGNTSGNGGGGGITMSHRSSFHSARTNPPSYTTTSRSSFSSVNGGNPTNTNTSITNNTGTVNISSNVYYGGRTSTPEPHTTNSTLGNDSSWLSPSTTHRTSLSYTTNPTNNNDEQGIYPNHGNNSSSNTNNTLGPPNDTMVLYHDTHSNPSPASRSRTWSIDSRTRAFSMSTQNTNNPYSSFLSPNSSNNHHGNNGSNHPNNHGLPLPSPPSTHHPQIFHQKAYHSNGLPIHNHTRHIYQNITGNNTNKNYYYNIQNIRNQIKTNQNTYSPPSSNPTNSSDNTTYVVPSSPSVIIGPPPPATTEITPLGKGTNNTTTVPYVYGGNNLNTMNSSNGIPPARKPSQSLPLNLYK